MASSEHLQSLPTDRSEVESSRDQPPSTGGNAPSTAGKSAETTPAIATGLGVEKPTAEPFRSAVGPAGPLADLALTASETLVGAVVGDVQIEGLIARGGMSHVYRGYQQSLKRSVAVKFPACAETPSTHNRFLREVEVLGRLSHPHIATLFNAGEHVHHATKLPYFVMELVPDAESLVDFCHRRQLPILDRLRLFLDACIAIAIGHSQGIVHHDIKPSNILVAPASATDADSQQPHSHAVGCVKVIDFGIASVVSDIGSVATDSSAHPSVVGSRLHMGPEHFAGDGVVISPTSDVYSLGVVLYELLTGSLPYDLEGLSLAEQAKTVQHTPPRPLRLPASTLSRRIRQDLQRLASACIAKRPGDRYAHAGLLVADLRRLLAGQPLNSLPHEPTSIATIARTLRHPRAAIVLIAIAVGLGGMVSRFWGSHKEERGDPPPPAAADKRGTSLLTRIGVSPDYPNSSHGQGADPTIIPERISPLEWMRLKFDPVLPIPTLEKTLTPESFQLTRDGISLDTSNLSLRFDYGNVYSCLVAGLEALTTPQGRYTLAVTEPLPPGSPPGQQPVTTPLYAWETPEFSRFRFNLNDDDWDRHVVQMAGLEQTTVAFNNATFAFLRPQQPDEEATLVMRFEVPFPIRIAWLRAKHAVWTSLAKPFAQRNDQSLREGNEQAPIDPGALVTIDVSADGNEWTTVTRLQFGHAGISFNPLDVSDLVGNSHEVWVRARAYATRTWKDDGVIFSQLFLTEPDATEPAFELDLTGSLPGKADR